MPSFSKLPPAACWASVQAVALNEGLLCRKKLWRERGRQQLEAFQLAPWASRRRRDLLELLDRLNPTIAELSEAIEREVEKCPAAQPLMTHPGVGALTALGFVLIIGDASRFQCRKQVAQRFLGPGAAGRFQWESATARTHYQAGEFDVAFSAGGGGPGHGTQFARMALQVCALDDAAWTQDGEGRDGAATSGPLVLDDAPGMGLSAVEQVRFARRTAQTSRWCSVEHRVIDWAVLLLLLNRGVRSSNHDRSSGSKRCMGRTEFLT